ncbi:MAG TPA: hypothetical protein VNZ94_18880 [Xanthobacteraceae bacterium]|nr:hypothetical protein [Xanthobacteraceae bacterium]
MARDPVDPGLVRCDLSGVFLSRFGVWSRDNDGSRAASVASGDEHRMPAHSDLLLGVSPAVVIERLEALPPKINAHRMLMVRAFLAILIMIALFFAGARLQSRDYNGRSAVADPTDKEPAPGVYSLNRLTNFGQPTANQ